MATTKRNAYLDAGDSDGSDNDGYDSEADELRKVNIQSSKRRRRQASDERSDASDNESDGGADLDRGVEDEDEDGEVEEAEETVKNKPANKRRIDESDDKDDSAKKRKKLDGTSESTSSQTDLPGLSRPLTKKNLVASEKAVKRSGVVYVSRVPPFMKPIKLRSLLAPYGDINRIFLSPEDPLSHARRVRGGGNKKRSFTDGWVEFVRKKDAKRAVDLLNGETIGGKKSSYYRDDLWNLVYLRGFKWHHLTEQIAGENAERASRMRAEISQTTRENKEFVRNVERAKMLDGIEEKRGRKKSGSAKAGEGETKEGGDAASAAADQSNARTFKFKQTSTVSRGDRKVQPEQVQRVLSKIF